MPEGCISGTKSGVFSWMLMEICCCSFLRTQMYQEGVASEKRTLCYLPHIRDVEVPRKLSKVCFELALMVTDGCRKCCAILHTYVMWRCRASRPRWACVDLVIVNNNGRLQRSKRCTTFKTYETWRCHTNCRRWAWNEFYLMFWSSQILRELLP